jgi:hypothetical protein
MCEINKPEYHKVRGLIINLEEVEYIPNKKAKTAIRDLIKDVEVKLFDLLY